MESHAHERGSSGRKAWDWIRERDVWSPSCAPCTDEAPLLAQAAREYNQGSVLFLAHIPQFDLVHWGISKSCTTPDLIRVSGSRGHPWFDRRVLGLDGEIAAILRR